MHSSYAQYSQNKSYSLWKAAQKIREDSPHISALGPYVFMTDPKRVDDPIAIAQKLPKGAVVIYRHYGVDNRQKLASQLRDIDGLTLLIGNDPDLARIVGADGVHMPRVTSASEIDKIRNQHKDWIITQAAPKTDSIIDPADFNTANIDALFVSPIFPSKSPSALNPIGIDALRSIAHNTSVPIYALGGISQETAPHLLKSGIAGLAAIEGIIKEIVMGEIMIEQTAYGHRLVYRKQGHTEAELTMVKVTEGLFNGNHTGVPKSMGGQGVGKALIKVMSDHAREHGYKVIPSCPFIAAMFKRKPAWGKDVWAKSI